MAFRVAVGNALDRATVTMVPAADTNYPAEYLHDGPGWLGARFGDLTADPTVTADLSPVLAGDGAYPGGVSGDTLAVSGAIGLAFETDWTLTTFPVADENAYLAILDDATKGGGTDHGGNDRSLYIASDEDQATAKLRFTLEAGKSYRMTAWTQKAVANGGAVGVWLYSPTTGKYLKPSDATWTSTPTRVATAGTYDVGVTWFGINAGAGVTFTTETRDQVNAETVELELQLTMSNTGGTAGLYDDISITPAVDLMMVAGGHNIPLSMAPVWETSDDGVTWANAATFAPARHQFFKLLAAAVYKRFHRLKMTGTPLLKHYMGDLILGLATVLPHSPAALEQAFAEVQVRNETAGRTRHISNRGPYAPRSLSFTLHMGDDDHFEAIRDLLYVAARGGAVPAVLLPSAGAGANVREPDLAIYGDLTASVSFSRPENSVPYRQCQLSIEEGAGFEIG